METIKELAKEFGATEKNTGLPEVQAAIFSQRITFLTKHLQANKKDHATQLALTKLVGKRKAFLNYLHKKSPEKYREVIKKLDLRK